MKYAVLCVCVMLSAVLGVNVAFAANVDLLSNEYLFTAYSKTEHLSALTSLEETNREVSGEWAYAYSSENSNVSIEESYLRWENVGTEDTSFLAMELSVDNKGDFVPNVSYIPTEEFCEFIVYLVKRKTATVVSEAFVSALSETDRLGVLRTEASCMGYKVQYFPKRLVEQGEYYLIFVSVDGGFSLRLLSFALNKKLSPEEMDTLAYNMTFTSTTLEESACSSRNYSLGEVSWKREKLNLEKTAPYAIEINKINNCRTTHGINEYGVFSCIKVQAYDSSISDRSVFPVRIRIPYAGKYLLSIENNFDKWWQTEATFFNEKGHMAYMRVFFGKAPGEYDEQKIENNIDQFVNLGWYNCKMAGCNEIGTIEVPSAGEYYVFFMPTEESLDMNPYVNGEIFKTNDTVAEADYQWFVLSGIELVPVENDSEKTAQAVYEEIVVANVENAVEYVAKIGKANIRAVASCVDDNSVVDKVVLTETSVNVGEKYTITAPEIPNYGFLYWKTGVRDNSKVVSSDKKYTFTVKSGEELLTAVYQNLNNAPSAAVFHNGNGQVLESVNGEMCVIPALPSMSGFGVAEYWKMYGSDERYFPGDEVEIKGMMNFVAQYGAPDMVLVEVTDGCTGAGAYSYGDVVTLTAPEKNGALLFNYWTDSNGEIVSFDSTFTFTAAFNCGFVAVYKDYLPETTKIRKIQVTQNGAYTMVTFIGTETAVERGVLFGESSTLDNFMLKKTMQTDATVFSIENKTGVSIRGYALFEEGKVIYSDD